ncbi:MAG: CAP domain-containing protein [Vulcanimicrobiota bacterium]
MKTAKILALTSLLSLPGWAAPPALPSVETRIVEMCNEIRKQRGLGPLEVRLDLQSAAAVHSSDMWDAKFFGHSNPANSADTLARRLQAAGVAGLSSAENLFRCEGYQTTQLAETAVASWMASPAHRANLLNPKFNCIGVSVCGTGGSYVFTQDFSSEAVSILSREVRRGTDGGYQLCLRARVCSGPREGAILLDGRRIANWTAAADGSFEVTAPLATLGTVQIGQLVGPRSWDVETEFRADRFL